MQYRPFLLVCGEPPIDRCENIVWGKSDDPLAYSGDWYRRSLDPTAWASLFGTVLPTQAPASVASVDKLALVTGLSEGVR